MVRGGRARSPFSVSRELMRDAALLARDKSVFLHTFGRNDEDIAYSLEKLDAARPICRRFGVDG